MSKRTTQPPTTAQRRVGTGGADRGQPASANRPNPPGPTRAPGWVDGREDHRLRSGGGAETADRAHRAAWPGFPLRSAYAHLLTTPSHVAAGDRAAAGRVHDRLLELLELGGWTAGEWARLHRMEEAWGRRAAGKDPKFNTCGWSRVGSGHHTPTTVKVMEAIRRELDGSDKWKR